MGCKYQSRPPQVRIVVIGWSPASCFGKCFEPSHWSWGWLGGAFLIPWCTGWTQGWLTLSGGSTAAMQSAQWIGCRLRQGVTEWGPWHPCCGRRWVPRTAGTRWSVPLRPQTSITDPVRSRVSSDAAAFSGQEVALPAPLSCAPRSVGLGLSRGSEQLPWKLPQISPWERQIRAGALSRAAELGHGPCARRTRSGQAVESITGSRSACTVF